jgi:hypothetical protein
MHVLSQMSSWSYQLYMPISLFFLQHNTETVLIEDMLIDLISLDTPYESTNRQPTCN